jgi:hypothetical protein
MCVLFHESNITLFYFKLFKFSFSFALTCPSLHIKSEMCHHADIRRG